MTTLPLACPSTPPSKVVNLDGVLVRFRVCFPRGSAGLASAPNGIQLIFKGDSKTDFASLYTPWTNIDPSWEGRCMDFSYRVSRISEGNRYGAL